MVGPVFFDTTVLLEGLIDLGARTAPAQRAMDAVAARRVARAHTAWHCCLEFYSVSTRLPAEMRLTPADALQLIEQEILPRFQVHQLPPDRAASFLQWAAREGTVGGRIYDAHIAEIARHARARIVVTGNRRHFMALLAHGIRVLTADEFVGEVRSRR